MAPQGWNGLQSVRGPGSFHFVSTLQGFHAHSYFLIQDGC